jgi:uncharacterized protein (DUF3820 family)
MARPYSTDPAVVVMPRGIYKGSQVNQLPIDYLIWAVRDWKTGKRLKEALLLELQYRYPVRWQDIVHGCRP